MSAIRWIVPASLGLLVSGCGWYVPETQENPFASPGERNAFIQEIVRNVHCEVQDAVVKLYAENAEVDPLNRNLRWFDSWGVQLALTLTTDEKGSLSPVVSWLPTGTPSTPSSIFSLNLGATGSTEGQRIDKIGAFFLVSDLKGLHVCHPEDRHRGPFILESDLKLYQWLQAAMVSIDNEDTPAPAKATGPLKSNVLSHEVKFDIISTGTVTPSWKLTQSTINATGTFLSATRDRTQDLSMTFGPTDDTWVEYVYVPGTNKVRIDPKTHQPMTRPAALAPAAASTALASDIANAIGNAVRNGLRQ
jgi:hypothetical protein